MLFRTLIWKRFLPFIIAVVAGVFAVAGWESLSVLKNSYASHKPISPKRQIDFEPGGQGSSGADFGPGGGCGECRGDNLTPFEVRNWPKPNLLGLRIVSKPRPEYTDVGREQMVQGTVILKITFLASGEIGSIQVVKGLSDGLTEKAVDAGRRIRFEPARKNGLPISVTKNIEYTFTIY